jgi:hypothetical protein
MVFFGWVGGRVPLRRPYGTAKQNERIETHTLQKQQQQQQQF